MRWDSEGDNRVHADAAALMQACAHVKAVSILYPQSATVMPLSELTADTLCEIHRTLFDQSLCEGSEWLVGKFRHENLCAGDYDFRRVDSQEEMRALVEDLLERLKSAMAGDQEGFVIASWFLSHFLMLHPFANGNGRMARLLFAYIASVRYCVPIPTVFSSGTSKARKQYYSALKRVQRYPANYSALLATGLRSVAHSMMLAKSFMHLAAADEDAILGQTYTIGECSSDGESE